MRVSTIPAFFIFPVLAISNQITDGDPKFIPSLVTGIVVGGMNVFWFRIAATKFDTSEST